MNIKRKIPLLLALLMCVGVYSQDTKSIAQNVLQSTVLIVAKDANSQTLALGSGFVIENELVVTNVHVVEGAKSVIIKWNNTSTELKSSGYVAIDKENDIVILKVPSLIKPSLNLSNIEPQVGEKIFVVGNPLGFVGTFTDGLISGIRDFNGRRLIQISAPISPGSSGGPVVNINSELIGISVSGMRDGQNLNFCIPTEYLIRLKRHIGTLTAYNISRKSNQEKVAYSGIRNAVTVRYSESEFSSSISIYNNLNQAIADVKLLFIVYGSDGIPVDTHEETFVEVDNYYIPNQKGGYEPRKKSREMYKNNDLILPKLAKRIEIKSTSLAWSHVQLRHGEKLKIRVLDYQIIEE